MGHRNHPAYPSSPSQRGSSAEDDARAAFQDRGQPPRRGSAAYRDVRDPRPLRDTEDEYRSDPYMAGNNTYREAGYGHEGPGYYGGSGRGAYEGAGHWDTDEDRARRGQWHSDDNRYPRRGMPPSQGSQGWQGAPGWAPYDERYDTRYDPRYDSQRHGMDHRRDLQRGDRPAGGYGSYGSSDGAYGDLPRQHGHHDPDYAQWRAEQMQRLDSDYRSWRDERYRKFSDEFDTWRSQRDAAATGAEPKGPDDTEATRETSALNAAKGKR